MSRPAIALPFTSVLKPVYALPTGYYPVGHPEIKAIDTFLQRNPCFIPLHDPPVNISRETHDYADVFGGALYRHSAVFVRLPATHFHATCRMYTFITRHQHPAVCPTLYQNDKYLSAHLGTIGWTNTVEFMVGVFRKALYTNRVFIATQASSESWKETRFYIDIKGVRTKMTRTWDMWADPQYCEPEHFAWNPWACNFISLSHCNTPAMMGNNYSESDRVFSVDEHAKKTVPYLLELQAIFDSEMTLFRDGIYDNKGFNEDYEYHRVLAFAQRPNVYLRARLRNSLQDLTVMKKSHHHANAAHKKAAAGSGSGVRRGASGGWTGWAGLGLGPPLPASAPTAASTTTSTTEQTLSSQHTGNNGGSPRSVGGKPPSPVDFAGQPLPAIFPFKKTTEGEGAGDGRGGNSAIGGGSVPMQGACVGLHVRNGDSISDMRNAAGHNLSFAAHMKCLETLTKEMGVYTLYLATDNNTLFSEAAKWYPQYKWYYQHRPLYAWTPQSPNYNFGTRRNAKSVQEDLADVIADMILMSRCSALMRSYSALGDLFKAYMCNRNALGQCPPDRAVHGDDCQKDNPKTKRILKSGF